MSQGTWVGAKVSARDPDLAFAVAVSGSGIPLWQQEVYRVTAMMDLYGYSKDDIDGARAFVTEKMTVGRTGLGWDALQARMKALQQNPPKWYNEFADPPGSLLSARYWWVAFFGYDPKADLARTHIPVLGVFGARDRVVPPKEALEAMRGALPPNKQHDFVELPDADHSMLAPVVVNGQRVCQLVLPEYLRSPARLDFPVVGEPARKYPQGANPRL